MIPLKVLNRLRMGRIVAARVPAALPNHQAWVGIEPVIDATCAVWDDADSLERRAIQTAQGNPISGYLVRYLELQDDIANDLWEAAFLPTIDEQQLVQFEADIADVVAKWVTDFNTLRPPDRVNYIPLLGQR